MKHSGSWCGLVLALAVPAAAQSFQAKPSEIVGVEVIGPSAPEFEALMSAVVPNQADRAQLADALPFSIIVRNSGLRSIQMITVRFEYTSQTLKPAAGTLQQSYGSGSFKPGSLELFTPSGALSSFRQSRPGLGAALRQLPMLKASPIVQASIDSAIYADGELVGPDRAQTFQVLSLENKRFRELLDEVRGMREQADSVVRTRLEQIFKEDREMVGMLPIRHRRSGARALLAALDHGGRDEMQKTLALFADNPPVPEVRTQK